MNDITLKYKVRKFKPRFGFAGIGNKVRSEQEGWFLLWLKTNQINYVPECITFKLDDRKFTPTCKIAGTNIYIKYRSQFNQKDILDVIHLRKLWPENKFYLVVRKIRQMIKFPKESYDHLLVLEENFYHDYENVELNKYLKMLKNL